MRKVLFLLCLFVLSNNLAHAEKRRINLSCQKVEETHYPGFGKVPMRMPVIYIDDHELSLSSSHPEYIINIIKNDEVVYSSVIVEGFTEFLLPVYLEGECVIQFIIGNYCFTGYIEL